MHGSQQKVRLSPVAQKARVADVRSRIKCGDIGSLEKLNPGEPLDMALDRAMNHAEGKQPDAIRPAGY